MHFWLNIYNLKILQEKKIVSSLLCHFPMQIADAKIFWDIKLLVVNRLSIFLLPEYRTVSDSLSFTWKWKFLKANYRSFSMTISGDRKMSWRPLLDDVEQQSPQIFVIFVSRSNSYDRCLYSCKSIPILSKQFSNCQLCAVVSTA